jgi:hypothetical protein
MPYLREQGVHSLEELLRAHAKLLVQLRHALLEGRRREREEGSAARRRSTTCRGSARSTRHRTRRAVVNQQRAASASTASDAAVAASNAAASTPFLPIAATSGARAPAAIVRRDNARRRARLSRTQPA